MNKQTVNKKEVGHWLGNSYEEWIHEFIFKLLNNKFTVSEVRTEVKQMYKDYREDK
jgi:hypothetical protein